MLQDPAREDEEPPLDPAAERVRRKLARLLFGSLGVMALGLIAVFAAIVYRVGGYSAEPESGAAAALSADNPVQASISLPAGARLVATALDGNRALLHLEEAGAASLVLVDLASGEVLGRYELASD